MIGMLRRIAGIGFGLGLALAIAGLSQLPYEVETSPDALLRLSWRSRGERIEHCRALTAEELANLPAHMRQRETCEGRNARYRLTVEVDGAGIIDQVAQGSGARQRRPIFVFRESRLTPGPHRIRVIFAREDEAQTEKETPGDRERREQSATLPARLALETRVVLEPRQVILVTYDPDRRKLVQVPSEPVPATE